MLDVINKLTVGYGEKEKDKTTEKSIFPLVCG